MCSGDLAKDTTQVFGDVGKTFGELGEGFNKSFTDWIGDNPDDKPNTPASTVADASTDPAIAYGTQNISDIDIKRRRSLSRLQGGFLNTIRTGALGVQGKANIDLPTLANGLKSRLGQ